MNIWESFLGRSRLLICWSLSLGDPVASTGLGNNDGGGFLSVEGYKYSKK